MVFFEKFFLFSGSQLNSVFVSFSLFVAVRNFPASFIDYVPQVLLVVPFHVVDQVQLVVHVHVVDDLLVVVTHLVFLHLLAVVVIRLDGGVEVIKVVLKGLLNGGWLVNASS